MHVGYAKLTAIWSANVNLSVCYMKEIILKYYSKLHRNILFLKNCTKPFNLMFFHTY